MSWILPLLFRLVFHEMPNSCIFKKPRIWQVFRYMTWYGKHIRKKYRWHQVLWADALIQMQRKTPERNLVVVGEDRKIVQDQRYFYSFHAFIKCSCFVHVSCFTLSRRYCKPCFIRGWSFCEYKMQRIFANKNCCKSILCYWNHEIKALQQ